MITALLASIFNIHHLLPILISQYGAWVYVGLFAVIFIETGLVVFPFLPGDSLLFLSGSLAAMASHPLNHLVLIGLLSLAAIAGDSVNFEIGHRFGHRLTSPRWQRVIKPQHLASAQRFFKKHGNSAIFLGRFMPIIRTLIPFTAGVSKMPYRKFILYNILGGVAWVAIAILPGYFFGNIPVVQAHFELIMIAIVVVSILPAAIATLVKNRKGPNLNA
ncbi:VTT domain-containing protein [Secundilactobacillus paracollinoides]|uniref:VTT domain-containing protein n=1 Tax=Secundilactobacillus paracollinoides TaxID=240427 RepID=UPI0006D029A3|nr:VTT domain-containing protein [Secundilactobacillus paracollinoides]KRL81570.1 DedA protein (DSG-1 protein) [Secundilactobacillus paracollinoides DSM 15502 = JCM 11969]